MVQIFYSHTKKDRKLCDEFDIVCARVGIAAFRSEFEKFEYPAWKRILNEINQSIAQYLRRQKNAKETCSNGREMCKRTKLFLMIQLT